MELGNLCREQKTLCKPEWLVIFYSGHSHSRWSYTLKLSELEKKELQQAAFAPLLWIESVSIMRYKPGVRGGWNNGGNYL